MTIVHAFEHLFLETGAAWVLWLLLVLSIASLAVAFDRWWVLRREARQSAALLAGLDPALEARDAEAARTALAAAPGAAERIGAAALDLVDQGLAAAQLGVGAELRHQRRRLEARLIFLGTLGNNAPFVGLFGTVIGVIQAFAELGRGGGAGGGAASQAVMAGIAEALVATAVGIGVALPAVAFYNIFKRKIAGILADGQTAAEQILANLGQGS